MSELTGLVARDVLAGIAIGVILPLFVLLLSRFPGTRRRPGLSFACYWVLLLFSAGLVTSAVTNLMLIGGSNFWMVAGAAGVLGILVTFSRGPALWRERRGRLALDVDSGQRSSDAASPLLTPALSEPASYRIGAGSAARECYWNETQT